MMATNTPPPRSAPITASSHDTATAKEREGEQRQVVVPRDRRAAAGTRRTGTPETPALGQAHDHDVQEAADGQAEETDGGERRGGRGLRKRPQHHLTTS